MLLRRALCDDLQQIVTLQNKHLIPHGYLATAFTLEQFRLMNEQGWIVTADQAGEIIGYLGACHLDYYKQFPVGAEMLKRLAQHDLANTLICSPACISTDYWGQGIYLALCKKMIECLPYQFEYVLTMVAVDNLRSLSAVSKLGFKVIDQFQVDNNKFYTLHISLRAFARRNKIIFNRIG